MRRYFSDMSLNDIKDEYVEYYSPTYENIRMNGDVDFQDDSLKNSVLVLEDYSIPVIWTSEKKKKAFSIYAKAIHQELTEPPAADESYPVSLKYPSATQYTLKIEMPEAWSFPEEEFHIKNGSYAFDFESKIIGNNITLKYYFKTFRDHIPAEELEQYRADYKKMIDVIEYSLSYTDVDKLAPGNSDGAAWPAIWITFVGFALMSLLFVKLNKRNIDVEYDRDSGWKIGGWMIVLGISLCIGAAILFYTLFFGDYYKISTWQVLKETNSGVLTAAYIELLFNVIKLSAGLAVIFWFFKRRDIFPTMFIYYVGIIITTQLSLWIFYHFIEIPESFGNIMGQTLRSIFQSLIYAAIWCTYVLRSYRTKATFLRSE
jgi:hypothetical protein